MNLPTFEQTNRAGVILNQFARGIIFAFGEKKSKKAEKIDFSVIFSLSLGTITLYKNVSGFFLNQFFLHETTHFWANEPRRGHPEPIF